jgi:hypothetical protein
VKTLPLTPRILRAALDRALAAAAYSFASRSFSSQTTTYCGVKMSMLSRRQSRITPIGSWEAGIPLRGSGMICGVIVEVIQTASWGIALP